MDYVTLGRDGPKVSAIGLGMWQAGGKAWGNDVNDAECRKAMERAADLGVTLVDTAEAYGDGHSEKVVGDAIRHVGRDRVFVATKVGGWHLHPDDVRKACAGSLRRLGVREIDLYQIHWPDPWSQVPLRDTMKALESLHRAGKIRHIGVSNFAVRDLEEARSHLSRTDIVSNQLRYNMLQREIEAEVLPYCKREGIGVLAWSPLGKAVLTGKYHAAKRPKDAVRKEEDLFKPANLRRAAPLVAALRKIGKARGKTPGQVALAWLRRNRVVVPIPGAKRPDQVEQNAGAAGWSLNAPELRSLDRILRRLRLDTF
ncbi:MAG TPA: aldo/keto reductase [Thermoplasmata archaeon]|nr:aldo/keto reductase [Thermoplasmata archaeon]